MNPINRRTLLRGSLSVAAAGTLAAVSSAQTASARQPDDPNAGRTDAEIYGVPTVNPLITQRADPFITHPFQGKYYFTGSVPEYDRIAVRGATTIAGLAGATESVIWRRPASGKMGGHIWAPELHRINDRWYVYFAAGDSDDVFRIRMYVLESALSDPLDPAGWTLKGQIATEWDSFSLDATTFAHRGRRYLVWAQGEPEIAVNSSLYIAEMASPWQLKSKPTRIATPTKSWEIQGYKVNEGPAVLVRNGRVFLTFSASATDARYCMGLLTASAGADLLDRASWVKTPDPIFVTDAETIRFGPGHNSFTVAEDGVTDVLVYHARDYRDITGDPLYDPNRHTRVQRLYWHPDGTPLFGVPVGAGGPIVRLSPADAPSRFVTRDGTALVVRPPDHAPATTQFRFVAGAGGAEHLQSVDFPDRHLRVVDGVVRIEAGTPAGLRRVPRGRGVLLQLAEDPTRYLWPGDGVVAPGAAAVWQLS
jgi:GH43 family beta-xylosidase